MSEDTSDRAKRPSSNMLLEQTLDVPLGVRLVEKIPFIKRLSYDAKNNCHKFNVLLLTFLSYASYHMARKPTSVVKNVLRPSSCNGTEVLLSEAAGNSTGNGTLPCAWSPFDADNGDVLLGWVDSSFLFAYAFGMFFMGSIGERMNVRYFLTIGMIMSGVFGFLFGLAYWTEIHSLAYFLSVQVLAGLFQSTGWPGCLAAVGNWFGKENRGLITGVWRSHHSIGNIAGSLIAGAFVEESWGLSFAVPALIIVSLGVLLFLFLVPDPRAVGCRIPDHVGKSGPPTRRGSSTIASSAAISELDVSSVGKSTEPIHKPLHKASVEKKEQAISFWKAVRIPGVLEYSFSLFFTKLINYTFLYWLPRYLKDNSATLGSQEAADLSTLFDIGGIFGGILAGLLSDKTGASAFTCAGYFILTIPSLLIYRLYGSVSAGLNIFLLFLVGFLANGPYALITTAVSADLGANPEVKGSSKALATVTAIIDGTGSIGAAVGPLIAGALTDKLGWDAVFYALMIASALGLLLLSRLLVHEFNHICRRRTDEEDNDGV